MYLTLLLCFLFYSAPSDYTGVLNQALTFSSPSPSMNVPVPIINDDFDEEDTETFFASLVLDTNNPRVLISPSLAEVIIMDNDG